VSDTGEIASLIRSLYEADPQKRSSAAAEIFERGNELARAATQKWLADEDLAACIVRDISGFPEATVGIAVNPDTFERIRAACRSPRLADVPPDQDAKEFELDFPHRIRLDILTTREPGGAGAVARYLQKFGEGIQQVEMHVQDADRTTEMLRTRFAVSPIYPATRPGADGTRVNFFLVPAGPDKKILIEIVEEKAPKT
jgi:hypothetical protein